MGAAPHASDGPGFAGPVRARFNGAAVRLSGRAFFQILGALVLLAVLALLVVRPAVERGGAAELLVIAGIFAAVLIVERWLRAR